MLENEKQIHLNSVYLYSDNIWCLYIYLFSSYPYWSLLRFAMSTCLGLVPLCLYVSLTSFTCFNTVNLWKLNEKFKSLMSRIINFKNSAFIRLERYNYKYPYDNSVVFIIFSCILYLNDRTWGLNVYLRWENMKTLFGENHFEN